MLLAPSVCVSVRGVRPCGEASCVKTNSGKRYSDEECFENLMQVWLHYGRQPTHKEIQRPPSIVGPKAYIGRWGTWSKALEAFVERVNREGDETADTGDETVEPPAKAGSSTRPTNRRLAEEDKHEIKLGLRWKVIMREPLPLR